VSDAARFKQTPEIWRRGLEEIVEAAAIHHIETSRGSRIVAEDPGKVALRAAEELVSLRNGRALPSLVWLEQANPGRNWVRRLCAGAEPARIVSAILELYSSEPGAETGRSHLIEEALAVVEQVHFVAELRAAAESPSSTKHATAMLSQILEGLPESSRDSAAQSAGKTRPSSPTGIVGTVVLGGIVLLLGFAAAALIFRRRRA